jgi:cyclic dehypoxanthinyl futalosine synthase
LNYTNVCITYCKFCVFYRQPGHEEAYTLSLDEVVRRIVKASELFGITQVLIQGGHNPNLKIEYYEEIFKAIKTKHPQIGVHGLSASEIDMLAKIEKSSIKEVLSRLKAAGLDSIPGFSECIL